MPRFAGFLSILLLLLIGAPSAAASELRLVDAQTGLGVRGELVMAELDTPLPAVAGLIDAHLAEPGRARRLDVDRVTAISVDDPTALRAEVAGYRVLHTVLRPAAQNRGWTLMLDPIEPEQMPVSQRDDGLIVSGWVSGPDGQAVAGARIELAGLVGYSEADGSYQLEIDAPVVTDGMPEPLSIRVSVSGFTDWVRDDVITASGGLSLPIRLGGPAPLSGQHRQSRVDTAWPDAAPGDRLELNPRGIDGNQPPASITVGFADAGCTTRCCTGNCPHSCTFSLEEYSRRGLPKEWIASWAFDALSAGAVAYRSYGAWHVFNPPAHGAYDLCSSACCQVNEPGTHSNTNAAVAATAGLMLMRNEAVFRSEYSAQNNCLQGELSCTNTDLSCGNGFVGSPLTGWPCLADPVGLNRACFGHGRGMSQWGNHYWSLESPVRRWKWQLNHYYNANGSGSGLRTATISQVLVIDDLRVMPPNAGPGQTITLDLDVRNLAAEPHANVLIGASLRQAADPFIDDPTNDQAVSLPPGESTISRSFTIPASASEGSYDVYASLYIDVDRNGLISSEDLLQQLLIAAGGLQVRGLFRDRFEGAEN